MAKNRLFMKKLLILIIITLFISCNNTKDKFIGIWMGDRENFYNPNEGNSENISLTQGLPILLDFKKENKLNLKIFGAKTFKNIEWKIENDSLLNINNIKYKIRKVTKDTISLELFTRAEKYDYKIYRIKDKKIKLDSSSVIQNLTTEIWSNLKNYPKERNQLEFENHIEYYKNSVRLLKYNVPLKEYGIENSSESVLNTYSDSWLIGKYKNYYFISQNDYQLYGTSIYFNINQITKLNNSELNIYRPNWTINQEGIFYKSKPKTNNLLNKKALVGLWKSENLGNKKYTYYKREVKESEKYKGNLFYEFSLEKLKIYGTETDTLICDWYLNRDKTILFNYNSWELNSITGINGEALDLKDFEKNSLELNLFNNYIYKDNNQYKLNINQKFERIKNH
tara:strand:+ start:2613 stop:3800 length:1188 start_codon:yes stop_codon:yes gene_type:complete